MNTKTEQYMQLIDNQKDAVKNDLREFYGLVLHSHAGILESHDSLKARMIELYSAKVFLQRAESHSYRALCLGNGLADSLGYRSRQHLADTARYEKIDKQYYRYTIELIDYDDHLRLTAMWDNAVKQVSWLLDEYIDRVKDSNAQCVESANLVLLYAQLTA